MATNPMCLGGYYIVYPTWEFYENEIFNVGNEMKLQKHFNW